jgi:hypothetical protein
MTPLTRRRPPIGYLEERPGDEGEFSGRSWRTKSCFLDMIVRLDDLGKIETIPIDLVTVEIDESPILHESLGARASTDRNRRGVDDVTEHALALCSPVLGNLTMELVYGRNRLLRLRQPALKLLARISYRGILALNGLPQRSKLPLTDRQR